MALVFAFMHLYTLFYCFCQFLLLISTLNKSGSDKSTEWPMISACPSLMFFFNRGNTEETNSSKILYLMFVDIFCKFMTGLMLWFLENLWFDDLRAE